MVVDVVVEDGVIEVKIGVNVLAVEWELVKSEVVVDVEYEAVIVGLVDIEDDSVI